MQASTGVGALAGEEIPPATGASAVSRWIFEVWQGYQHLLDKWNPKGRNRWIASSVIAILYVLRVVYIQGFHIISYALGIYLLCLLMEFVSPLVDPEAESHEGPTLPTRNSDEFRPFVRRLPEFKFWYSFTTAFCIAFVLTFFGIFDVPVYWPILLGYWMFMLIHMMRSQILHMMKHKYIPFSTGKQTYSKKKSPSVGSESLLP